MKRLIDAIASGDESSRLELIKIAARKGDYKVLLKYSRSEDIDDKDKLDAIVGAITSVMHIETSCTISPKASLFKFMRYVLKYNQNSYPLCIEIEKVAMMLVNVMLDTPKSMFKHHVTLNNYGLWQRAAYARRGIDCIHACVTRKNSTGTVYRVLLPIKRP